MSLPPRENTETRGSGTSLDTESADKFTLNFSWIVWNKFVVYKSPPHPRLQCFLIATQSDLNNHFQRAIRKVDRRNIDRYRSWVTGEVLTHITVSHCKLTGLPSVPTQ